jgi:hypothetical protein
LSDFYLVNLRVQIKKSEIWKNGIYALKAEGDYQKRKIKLEFYAKKEATNMILRLKNNYKLSALGMMPEARDNAINFDDCQIFLKFWDTILQEVGLPGRDDLGTPRNWMQSLSQTPGDLSVNQPAVGIAGGIAPVTPSAPPPQSQEKGKYNIPVNCKDLKLIQKLLAEADGKINKEDSPAPQEIKDDVKKAIEENAQKIKALEKKGSETLDEVKKLLADSKYLDSMKSLKAISDELKIAGLTENLGEFRDLFAKGKANLEISTELDKLLKESSSLNVSTIGNQLNTLLNKAKEKVGVVQNTLIEQIESEIKANADKANTQYEEAQDIVSTIIGLQEKNKLFKAHGLQGFNDQIQNLLQNLPNNLAAMNRLNQIKENMETAKDNTTKNQIYNLESTVNGQLNDIFPQVIEGIQEIKTNIDKKLNDKVDEMKKYVLSIPSLMKNEDREVTLKLMEENVELANQMGLSTEAQQIKSHLGVFGRIDKLQSLFGFSDKLAIDDVVKVTKNSREEIMDLMMTYHEIFSNLKIDGDFIVKKPSWELNDKSLDF